MRRLTAILQMLRQHAGRLPSAKQLIILSIFGSLSAGGLMAYHKSEQLVARFYEQSVKAGFGLAYLDIKGRNHTDTQQIIEQLGTKKGDAILALNLNQMRKQLLQIGWVEDALITRKLPDRLEVRLIERRPVALWHHQDTHQVIDPSGAVITEAQAQDFSHLPVVSGKNAPSKAFPFLKMLQTEPDIYADVWAVQFISERRWDVYLRSGVTVRLPETNPGEAWSTLAKLEEEKRITSRDISTIDLRVPQKLVVEPNTFIPTQGQKT